ncbi:MAG: InlB B-repeat-containing protein [Paludibacteraceae bacterium]|nr:InlB B-repeat-containing protein [Paludibacteraceae bacterium]
MTTSPSFAQMANNQSISLSSALRANTPPTKGQTPSRKFLTLSIFFLLSFFCTTTAWGVEVTAINNIISGNTYYIKGVRSSSTYYLKFTDSKGSQKGTETSNKAEAIPITFIEVSGGWNLKTPTGNYIAPGTSNGTINVSTTAITVTATSKNSKIRLSITSGGTEWSIQKNSSAANFGGYKNTQTDITLVEASTSSPINPTVTFSDGEYTVGGAALDLSTLWSSNSTGDVTYSITDAGTTGATIAGSTFTATAAGQCTVQASQAATATHNTATAIATITVSPAQGGGGSGSGGCTWELVTDVSTLKADDEIIIAASGNNNYALSTNQKSSNRGATAITKNGNTLTSPSADVQILALKAGSTSGTWAFYTGTDGYLYAASSSGNQLKTKTALDVHGSWTISITDGVASIVATGSSNRNIMQYNYNNGSPLFACYSSATQTSLALYKKVCTSSAPTTYTVTYALNGGIGTTPTETNKAEGDEFNLAASTGFSKTGYRFMGWNDGTTTYAAGAQYTMPAENVTLTAQWKTIPKLTTPANLEVTNISCTGATLAWDNVANNNGYLLSVKNTSSSTTFNSNIAKDITSGSPTLNPGTTYTWKVVAKGDGTNYNNSEVADGGSFTTDYKITYNVKGGTWTACADGCVAGGEDFTICSTVPTKTGYNFMGWSTADDQIAEYQAEETIENVSANITLYAVWEQKKYTVNWYVNSTSKREQTGVVGAALTDIPEPTTVDCDNSKVFVGWTTIADYSDATDAPDGMITNTTGMKMPEGGATYYAVFATAEGGGGAPEETTLTIPYQTLTTGLSNSYSTKNFTYGGFTFEINACVQSNYCQMRDNATLSYIYIPELPGAITKIATSDCKNTSGSSYTGTLRLKTTKTRGNSETDDIEAITYSSVNSFSWSLSNETYKTGYLFTSAGLRIKDLSITYTTSGGTSYSEYVTTCVQVTKYNVNYNIGDGATGAAPTETSKAEGTIFTLASADGISKEGYSFAGWLCDKDGNIYGASEEYTMPAANVTFTAQWNELPKYTVTFYNKGKKHSEVAQTIANAPIECPTGLVACDGYSFAGWSTKQLDGVSTFTKIGDEYTPESDITLYAVYAEGNATTNGWVKVTDLSTITEGTYALLSNNNYAFNGTINNNSDGEHTTNSFVFNGEGVASEAPSGTCEIELIASGDGFKMYTEGKGYLYAKAAKSGNLAWQQNENSSWSWDSTKDNWVYAEKNAFLRSYNNTFRTYGTNNGNAIYLAKKNVTSFTTSPACDPMITIGSPEPVMVTSANGIRVDAVQNITISATNLDQNADAAQVSIKLVSDNSAFKFKEVGANGDGQATSTWAGIANATFDKTLCVTYTPTEAGQEETAILTVTAYRHNGSTEYATATMQVRGRSLPEQFVLVANTGDGWVALPNTLGTGSTASIPYPIAVEVDNDDDPTSIPLAPSTTIYKAAARSTVNAIPTGLRFTTETGGYMQASTTETNIWLASNNSENMQSWTLNSTDFVDYSIRVNNAAEGHNLNYSNTQKKIGNYKSDNKLRILPIEDICVQHAAPENIDVVSVSANAATIQWDAVATATLGYEYRIGATGEWTKVGNVTELELTLSSLTNYTVYVRASVEGTNTNCSYEAEAEFTTLNCDDVPYDIHYASGANSVTVYWTCEAATSTISLYHDKEGLSLVETKTSVTSPCQFTSLDKFTTYYVQIQAGGSCPSGMIQVRTEQLDLDVVEWMSDGVVVDVNTDETITVTLENEVQYGSGVGQVAEELFFSKYFEGSGNLKLLAIYNGTGKDVDLSTYRIDRGSNGNATKIGKIYNLSQLGTIKNGQEIIFYSKPNVSEYPYSCSQSFLASKVGESGIDANPRWILCDAKEHNGVNFEAMDFNGDDPLLLYKGNTLIDVFGVSTAAEQPSKKTQCSGRTENSWSADDVANMDYGKTEADFEGGIVPDGVDLLNPTITAYTARVIMFRKNTVLSGSNAVAKNITDFVTLASEWEVRTVCKDGDDGNLTCGAYQELGKFNYADYYTKYETMAGEQVFDENARRDDGTIKIRIPNLSTYSCMNIKFNIKVGGVTVNEVTKVPILIADEQSTNGGDVFANLKTTLGTKIVNGSEVTIEPLTDEQLFKKCETCDIVVLANGKLTHEADGINQFNDLTIYPEGTFNNTSDFTVNRLLVHAKLDEVGCAIVENNGVTLTTNAIAHTKRIDAKYWYPFSLPYNCNIADIKQASGESMGTYGVHWGIQYYDGQRRQASGTSAGIGQSSNFWTPMGENDQLNAYQGYVIALFDDAVEKETDMRTIYFPPVVEQMYTESGTDSKETTITSWNVNLEAEKRHHGWNFTGSPYISVFNPQATGLSEDCGLFSEVLIVSGHYDQGSNEYLYDDEYVYVSIPSPNGAKYYDQNITSATSLKPFTAYFVQAIDPTSGNDETQTLAYAKAGRELPTSAPRRSTSTRQRVLVELGVTAPDGQTDNTGIWVDEKYTSAYEIAADLTKMYVAGDRPQLYTMAADNEKMAYNALPDEMAGNVQLGLYAPTAGSYTLFINERVSRLKGVERVDLLYNNVVVADLLSSAYVIDVPKKGAVNGYTISVYRKANVTTAIDNISGQPINIITGDGYLTLEGIVSDAQVSVYDMLGRLVAAQNANDETNIRIPFIVQGVYNVVVKNEQGMTTIKVVLR